MQRLALCYRAIPEKKQEYIKAHKEIWPEITRGLKDAGCHEMTIFLRGNSLFLYALIDDIAEFNRIRAKDPSYNRWNDWTNKLLEAPFDARHPVLKGLGGQWPALLGLNELAVKEGSDLLVRAGEHPLLAVASRGKGRTLAWASDIGPHWCPEAFTLWSGYASLWKNSIRWLAGELT